MFKLNERNEKYKLIRRERITLVLFLLLFLSTMGLNYTWAALEIIGTEKSEAYTIFLRIGGSQKIVLLILVLIFFTLLFKLKLNYKK